MNFGGFFMSEYSGSTYGSLKSKKTIERLFNHGKSVYCDPVRLIYLVDEPRQQNTMETLFTVPKRKFKRAVKRNLLKRRMREAFRNKVYLLDPLLEKDLVPNLVLVYNAEELYSYKKIESGIEKSFHLMLRSLGAI